MKRFEWIIVVLVLASGAAHAASVTWNGTGDMEWTQPDANSFSAAYNSGDTVTFAATGVGTVTVDAAGVTPAAKVFATSGYTVEGGNIGGTGDLTVISINVTLSNTNTYTGFTDAINGGTITFRGKDSVSPNTTLRSLDNNRGGSPFTFLMDDSGTVNLGNELQITGTAPYDYGTAVFTIHVANNGGATTGSTIALGKKNFTNTSGNLSTSRILRSTGANGYRLQFGDVDMNWFFNGTSMAGPQGFYSDTAPITITGTVKQINGGTAAADGANGLFLGGTGTTTTNYITGVIKNASDYDDASNPNAKPLFVRVGDAAGESIPVSTAIWQLSNSNTYSGGTYVRYGTLIAGATNALGDGDVRIDTTSGRLIIDANDAASSNATLYLPNNTTETLTMNGDCTVGALYLGGVSQPNGDYTGASAWMGGAGTLTVGPPLMFWDIDGATAGAGGATPAGTWDTGTTANWGNLSDGTSAAFNWSPGLTAVFAAGTDATGEYTVTVDGINDIGGLTFEEGSVTLSGGGLRMTENSSFYVAASKTSTVATAVSDDGNARRLLKIGDGILVLPATNSYSGATVVGAGTLQLVHTNAIASSSSLTLATGATLQLRSNDGATFNTPPCDIASAANTTMNVNNNASGNNNTLTLGGGMLTTASWTLNVTGGNGYTLNIPASTFSNATAAGNRNIIPTTAGIRLGTVALLLNASSGDQTLVLDGTNALNTIDSMTISRTAGANTYNVTKQNTSTWTIGSFNGGGGAGNQFLLSAGTIIVTNSLDVTGMYTGLILNGGTLHYNSPGAVRSDHVNRFRFNNASVRLENSSGAAITTSTYNPQMAWNASFTFVGTNGVNSDLNLGTGAVTLGATPTVTINSNATLTVGGVISGAQGVIKAGSGTLRLDGVNTYTGTTTVSAGVLAGTGTIATNITVASGATLAPGSATGSGTLTVVGNATLQSGSTLRIDVNDPASSWTKLAVNGTLDITGAALEVTGAPGKATYEIVTCGFLTGTFSSVIGCPGITYSETSIVIAGTPPGTVLIIR